MNASERDILLTKINERTKNTQSLLEGFNISNSTDHATFMSYQRETNGKVNTNESQISKLWGTLKGFAFTIMGIGIIFGVYRAIVEIAK